MAMRLWRDVFEKYGVEAVMRTQGRAMIEAAVHDSRLQARMRDAILSYSGPPDGQEFDQPFEDMQRSTVVRDATLVWRSGEMLDRLVNDIMTDGCNVEEDIHGIYKHRRVWRQAATAMEKLASELDHLPKYPRLKVAQILFEEGDGRAVAVLEELASSRNEPWVAVDAAALLAEVPERCGVMVRRLEDWARSAENGFGENARAHLQQLAVESPEVEALIVAVASDPGVPSGNRLGIIRELARRRSPEALRVVEQLAGSGADVDEKIRLDAAKLLQEVEQAPTIWRPVLEQLSRSAKTGRMRLRAAEALRDEKRIRQLSFKAKNERVRKEAAQALGALRLHRAILEVGKRARSTAPSSAGPA